MKEHYYLVANVFARIFHPEYHRHLVVVLCPIFKEVLEIKIKEFFILVVRLEIEVLIDQVLLGDTVVFDQIPLKNH